MAAHRRPRSGAATTPTGGQAPRTHSACPLSPAGAPPGASSGLYSHRGVTIVHKHDGERSSGHRPAKVALVLAGGALTGGAFKLGALKALDDVLLGRKTTDLDLYVGLSAGALLAAPLAAGVGPAAMLPSLRGVAGAFTPLQALDLYSPNLAELVAKPLAYLRDLVAYAPAWARDLVRRSPRLLERIHDPVMAFARAPSRETAQAILAPLADALFAAPQLPSPLAYLPTGLFDNAALERYLRRNLERNGIPNDFRALARQRGSALYVVATDVDTAERVVFGHDENTSLTISEAVQASTALPGFYKPARLGGVDYVDGGVRRTANIDVAIEHGAELIICYNPFRPFSNRAVRHRDPLAAPDRTSAVALTDRGLLTVLNQVLRTLLHSRLQLGLHQYLEDPRFRGDILLIEPMEEDVTFFEMAPLDFRQRHAAAQHGYVSATRSLESNHEAIAHVLERHGLGLAQGESRAGADRIAAARVPDSGAVASPRARVRQRRAA